MINKKLIKRDNSKLAHKMDAPINQNIPHANKLAYIFLLIVWDNLETEYKYEIKIIRVVTAAINLIIYNIFNI